ncbi:hypothetical protein [Chryseobacterium wanjuense]
MVIQLQETLSCLHKEWERPSIGVKIPQSTIDELKQLYQDKKAAIIGARIRIYTDKNSWSNSYVKPTAFTFLQKYKDPAKINPVTGLPLTITNFTSDVLNLSGVLGYTIYKTYDLDKNPAYYEFVVTKSIKDFVESTDQNTIEYNKTRYFRIDMGSFLSNSNSNESGLAGYQYTSRAYNTNRAVFVGSDPSNANRVQLKVTYGTK